MQGIPSPCFLLEEEKLIRNMEVIARVQKEAGVTILLALKGFSMWSVFPLLSQYVRSATASSLHEATLCVEKMGTKAHTYCVAYESGTFDALLSKSSHLTFNSLAQYNTFIERVPGDISVGLRVNPGWSDVETSLYNPADLSSRLGEAQLDLSRMPERIEGLHFHVLCESSSYALEKVLTAFESKFGGFLPQIKWVNMGGGHLMTRSDYDAAHLIRLLTEFKSRHGVDVILEPGSAFAWEVGDLHTQILDIVDHGGKKTVIFNGSFTCHMPDCLEMPYRPKIVQGAEQKVDGWLPYRLGGVSCLAGDFMEEYWFEKPLAIGDPLVFKDMMHYTMVKTSFFNGLQHPAIAIKRLNGHIDVVRSFGYEDYKQRLS